jgi:hypothetical protein
MKPFNMTEERRQYIEMLHRQCPKVGLDAKAEIAKAMAMWGEDEYRASIAADNAKWFEEHPGGEREPNPPCDCSCHEDAEDAEDDSEYGPGFEHHGCSCGYGCGDDL